MPRARHRTTYRLNLTKNETDADSADWLYGYDESSLDTASVAEKYRKVSGETVVEMTDAEKVTLDKPGRKADVDKRTGELIADGFTYSSKTFSLSANAQTNWNGLKGFADDWTGGDYPIEVMTLDDADFYSITDATDAKAFAKAAADQKKTHLLSGKDLKKSLNDATTMTALDAVVDSR